MRRLGEHGPPRDRQSELIEIAKRLGAIPEEESEAEWLERLRRLGNRKEQVRANAGRRRDWWEVDAYGHYILLSSLGSLYRDEAVGAPLRVPPEIDPQDPDGRPIPQKTRHRFDAEQVATWAYRHRRHGIAYAKLESAYHEWIERALREGRVREEHKKKAERALERSDFVRRVVKSSARIWALAERDVGLA